MTFLPLRSASELRPPPFVAAEKAGAGSPSFNFNSGILPIVFVASAINYCSAVGELVGCEPSCLTPSQTYKNPEIPVQTAAPTVQMTNHGSAKRLSHLSRIHTMQNIWSTVATLPSTRA